jgi:hypothetical protein
MRLVRLFALAALAAASTPAVAQPQIGASPEAVAAAARPGDEDLTCDQLVAELTPAGQALAGSFAASGLGENAQAMKELMDRRMAQARGEMVTGMAVGAAAALLPGGGALATAQAQAQAARMQAQAAADKPTRDAFMASAGQFSGEANAMMAADPRIQHVMQLFEKKNCQEQLQRTSPAQ